MIATATLASTLFTAAAMVAAPSSDAATPPVLPSYTTAYNTAEGRPMLVVLNPGDGSGINVDRMKQNGELDGALDDYVIAEIDTTTDHGQQVRELFNSPALPFVVLIDGEKNQVYKTSGQLTASQLKAAANGSSTTEPVVTVTSNRPVVSADTVPVSSASVVAPRTFSAPVQSSPVIGLPTTMVPQISAPANCPSCQRAARARMLRMNGYSF